MDTSGDGVPESKAPPLRHSTRRPVPPGTARALEQEATERRRLEAIERLEAKRDDKAAKRVEIAEILAARAEEKQDDALEGYAALKQMAELIGNGTGQDVTAVGNASDGRTHAAAQRPQLTQAHKAAKSGVTWHQSNPRDNVHAEMWLLYLIDAAGLVLTSISADRAICSRCAEVLADAGVDYDKAYIQARTPNWTNPWAREVAPHRFKKYKSCANGKEYTYTGADEDADL